MEWLLGPIPGFLISYLSHGPLGPGAAAGAGSHTLGTAARDGRVPGAHLHSQPRSASKDRTP